MRARFISGPGGCLVRGLALVLTCLGCTESRPSGSLRSKEGAGNYRPLLAQNAQVAAASRIDQLQPGGPTGYDLTGRDVLLGEWDQGGVRDSHQSLVGRVRLRDGAGLSDHATHTAGTLIGAAAGNPAAAGMAPEARLWSYSWDLDLLEMRNSAPFLSASNHSYGITLGWYYDSACPDLPSWAGGGDHQEDPEFGKYDLYAAELDRVIQATDLVSVWAAGNERADGPPSRGAPHHHWPSCEGAFTDTHASELDLQYDTIGGQPAAKNVITVGAIVDLPAAFQPSDVLPLVSSSFGPLDDGRIKPDLVAGGDDVTSAVAWNDAAYSSESGTSPAAAGVTGGIGLLVEHYRQVTRGRDPRAAEIKALLIQTAQEVGASPGPDYRMGYGLFDAAAAARMLEPDASLVRVDWTDGSTNELETAEPIDAHSALRVTLVWTDPGGAPNGGGIDDPSPALVNDLDIELVAPDGVTVFHPWSLARERPAEPATRAGPNRVDNVERVDVPAEDNVWTGAWTVRISVNGRLLRDQPQAYALVSSAVLAPGTRPTFGGPRRIYFQATPSSPAVSRSLGFQSLGSSPLEWHASEAAPWLTLGRAAGTSDDALELAADATGLASPGLYQAEIELSANDPTAPSALGVVLEVACEPRCDGRVCGRDPVCGVSCGRCSTRYACSTDGQCEPVGTECPQADLGSELGVAVVESANDRTSDSFAGSCGGQGSPESAFLWTAPRAGVYEFSTEGSRYGTVLYLRADDCGGAELGCSDDGTVTAELRAGQRVVVIVDGQAGAPGEFALSIQAATCPAGDLRSLLGTRVLVQAAPGRTDRWQGSCGGGNGARELALRWRAPVAARYSFQARGSDFDPVVYLFESACGGNELGCGTNQVIAALDAGAEVIVVLDGARSAFGRYDLAITAADLSCQDGRAEGPAGPLCWCDEACARLGDCCSDAPCPACPPCQQCTAGRCQPVLDGEACDDGDLCTEQDTCQAGSCRGAPLPCTTDGGSPDGPTPERPIEGSSGLKARGGAGGCGCMVPGRPRVPATSLLLFVLGVAVVYRRAPIRPKPRTMRLSAKDG